MNKSSMQIALGEQWQQLPPALKAHYNEDENGENHSQGLLTIEYPWFMQWPLSFFRLFGALVNRRGVDLTTTVSKINKNGTQYWHREVNYPNGEKIIFDSKVILDRNNYFIEYVNNYLGLKMQAQVQQDKLYYESKGYVLKLGKIKIPIPEWLALGHASIIEWQEENSAETFNMDFRIKHPLFGELFCYKGQFTTNKYKKYT